MKEKNKRLIPKITVKKTFIMAVSFLIVFFLAILPFCAQADSIVTNAMNAGFGLVMDLIQALIKLGGGLLVQLMFVVVWLSQFNSYIDNPYVNEGWVVLRDLVNMFFVLGLLFIAFVTVLKIEKQPWNKMLGRLLVMAILVNFSKTICGIIIDFFQVLMITFVNAYKDITAGNIENALNMTEWFKQGGSNGSDVTVTTVAGAILGLIYTIVTLIVVCIFCVILAIRMIALWILIVFSPVAFFAWSVTGISGKIGEFANLWWNQFFNYCIVGPFIAFFLWLSLVTMVKLNYDEMVKGYTAADRAHNDVKDLGNMRIDNLISILLGIIMLVAGLQMSAKYAGAGASLATKGANFIKDQTAGRLERTATSVGRTGMAYATAPIRTAGAVVAAPFMAAGAYVGGRVQGAKESLQRGKYTRLLTKEGREQAVGAARARGEAHGAGELATRDMRAQQAQDYKKIRKDVNWENPEQIKQLQESFLEREIDPKTGKKTGKILKNKNTDMRFWEATYTAKADAGKLTYKDVDDMEQLGLFSGKMGMGKSGRGKQVFLEDMEKRYEKKTHIKKAFSSLIYNAETNEYEDINGLEERGNQVKTQAQASGHDLSKVNFEKVAKREKDGSFTLQTDAPEFKEDLDPGTQTHLRSLYDEYQSELAHGDPKKIANKTDFYAVARSNDIRTKKQGEIRKAIATAPEGDLNEAGKIANMGDIMQNPPDYAVAEVDGFTDQIPRIGKLDKIARENVNVKARFLMGDDTERVALIEKHKNLFDSSLHGKSATELGAMPEIKKLDEIRGKMDAEKLKKFQNLIVESSSEFNAIGQKLEGGEGQRSDNLDNLISSKAVPLQGGVENEIKTLTKKKPRRMNVANEAKAIDEESAGLLEVTKNEPSRKNRIENIAVRIQKISSLDQDESKGMAEYIINNEVKIKSRTEAAKDAKKRSAPNARAIVNVTREEFKAKTRDAGRVNHLIDIYMNQLRQQITSGGLLEKDIRPKEIENELKSLVLALRTATDEGALNNSINIFNNRMRGLGINLQEEKKKTTRP